jgi:hypothetical protein
MKRFPMKKLVITSLTAAMVLGAGTSAFAKDSKDKNDWKNWKDSKQNENKQNNGNGKGNGNDNGWHGVKGKFDFGDIQGKDLEWALRYIASLASRNIFEGYSDGTFRPYEKVTRIEAITAAVRLMGLREQAESAVEMQTKLNFKDANQVPSWAVGYVSVALKNDLFSESETMVQPNQPSDRLWATTLLVKALKLESEAKTKMNVKLSFADAAQIPAGSVGYVAVAVERGLVNGFEDNTFRPNQPVTRAEIAALLDRAGDQLPDSNSGLVTGTVTAPVSNNVLRLNKGGQTVTLTLDPNAFIYRGGAKVSASALQAGDVVKTRSYNNVVIFVEVTSGGTWPNQPNQPTVPSAVNTGTVTSLVNNNLLTITNGSQTVSLPVHAEALYFRNGSQVNASALQIGDIVSTRAYHNAVVYVEVTQTAGSTVVQPAFSKQVTGTLVATGSNTLTLVNGNGGQVESLALNSGAFIYRGGSKVSSSSLQAGDVVTVYAYNNTAAIVEVTQSAVQPSTSSGTTMGTVAVPSYGNTLVVTSGGQNIRLNLDSNAFIFRAGGFSGPGALQQGDVITVRYYNNSVIYAEVTQLAGGSTSQPVVSQTTGTILTTVSNNILTLINSNQASTLTLIPNVFIMRNGVKVNASDLQIGDVVTVRSYNNAVIFVEVTQNSSNSNQAFTAAGTFSSKTLNSQGVISTISIHQSYTNGSTQTITYNVATPVSIYGDPSKLAANQQVVLHITGQTVTSIYIQ